MKIDDRLVLKAISHLTDRDRYICGLLADHQVLTTHQIRQACFDSQRRATLRLAQLHRLRIVDRFRPLVPAGSAPNHWILDNLGAAIVAAERGVEVAELGWRRDKTVSIAASRQLCHLVGTNRLFCSLLDAARHRDDAELVVWWSARRCAGKWGNIVRPDGYGVWEEGGRRTAFLLEYDNATERVARLADKLDRYQRLFSVTGQRIPVLFSFPGPGRESNARRVLQHPGVPVATCSTRGALSAADAVWLPTNTDRSTEDRRVRLADIVVQSSSRSR